MKRKRLTFNQICTRAENDNSRKLMGKAYLANRVAKNSRGKQRRTAYAVKANALSSLVRKMPELVTVHEDFYLDDFVVVELKSTNRGLHFPVERL